MKHFIDHQFDAVNCRSDLTEYRSLLDGHKELSERTNILPFFRGHHQLSAFIGSYFPYVSSFDRIAFEYDLFGDLGCDLVVGDRRNGAYCFVEFEDARRTSIFEERVGRGVSEWGRRFEHGFSQVVDWFWKLSEQRDTVTMEDRFGTRDLRYQALLVIGRDEYLGISERRRMSWRLDRVSIDSARVFCVTFDQLYADLDNRLRTYESASE